MIRDATIDDVDWVVDLSRRFYAVGGFPGVFDADKTRDFAIGLIEAESGILLRGDSGFIAGVVVPLPFAKDNHAVEMAWWGEGREGLALLRAFERRASDMGAHHIALSVLKDNTAALRRLGYSVTQYSAFKEV